MKKQHTVEFNFKEISPVYFNYDNGYTIPSKGTNELTWNWECSSDNRFTDFSNIWSQLGISANSYKNKSSQSPYYNNEWRNIARSNEYELRQIQFYAQSIKENTPGINYHEWKYFSTTNYYYGPMIYYMYAIAYLLNYYVDKKFDEYTPGTAGKEYKDAAVSINIKCGDRNRGSMLLSSQTNTKIAKYKPGTNIRNVSNNIGRSIILCKYKPGQEFMHFIVIVQFEGTEWHWEYPPLSPPILVGEPFDEQVDYDFIYEAQGLIDDISGNIYDYIWELT